MILPDSRVLVFDASLFVDDVKTPLSHTMKPATVTRRYGYRSVYNKNWIYDDLVDVVFDHNGSPSRGHFTRGIKEL